MTNSRNLLQADRKESVQIVLMRRLSQVFTGRTCDKVHFYMLWPINIQNNHLLCTVFTLNSPNQTAYTQIRRRRMRRLIWVYTVCQSSSNF